MGEINQGLNTLLQQLPRLSDACKDFCVKAKDIQKVFPSSWSPLKSPQRREANKKTIASHPQLLELLEIPQLMDTCVRNACYEEALELETFTRKLKRTYPDNRIVQDIVTAACLGSSDSVQVEEVAASTDMMLFQLHQKLRSNIHLPDCLRVIGYLKRLGASVDSCCINLLKECTRNVNCG